MGTDKNRWGWRTTSAVCLIALLACLSLTAKAAAGGAQNSGNANGSSLMLNSQFSIDSANDQDVQLGGEAAISDTTAYNFLAEYTSSPAGRLALTTHTYSFGVDQDFNAAKNSGFGLRYEWWGKTDTLDSNSFYGSLYYALPDWQATLLPGIRQIDLDTRRLKLRNIFIPAENHLITDRPLGLRVDFTGLQNWLFEVSSTRHNYTLSPAVLGGKSAFIFFTGSALTLSQGFLSHSSSVRIERDFDLTSLAYDYEIDRSAIDGTYSYTWDIDFTTPISDSFDMEIMSGVTRSAHTPQTGFITLNFTYYH